MSLPNVVALATLGFSSHTPFTGQGAGARVRLDEQLRLVRATVSVMPDVACVRAASAADIEQLSEFCTDIFYGAHTFWSGPVIFVQRRRVLARVQSQIKERVAEANDSERLVLVALERDRGSDFIIGMVDIAVHLFDSFTSTFDLASAAMPDGGEFRFQWRPYVSALAVRPDVRRRGIARSLMREAEAVALSWGYNEAYLEVAEENELARNFYERIGYQELSGTSGSRQTKMAVRGAGVLRWWVTCPVKKGMMSRRISTCDEGET